jgi:hypothetical protein
VALPLLDAMVPAGTPWTKTAEAAGLDRTRLVCIEMVHGSAGSSEWGASQNLWSPATTGASFDLAPSALSPLEPFRKYLTIVSDTDVRGAEAVTQPEIGGDHFRSSAVFLTQTHPKQTESSDVRAGTRSIRSTRRVRTGHADSVDAAVHRERRSGWRLRLRLLVRLHRHDQLGVADRAAADDRDPRMAFDQLFGAGGSTRNAPRAGVRRPACSTTSRARSRISTSGSIRAIASAWIATWTTCAKSSGEFRRSRRAT